MIELPDLPRELMALLAQLPRGCATTYGDLARALGDVRAARWVGEFLLDHPHGDDCPCHRVVRTGGEVGLYITRDSQEKIHRLAAEGIPVEDGRVDPKRLLTAQQFACDAPLARLLAFQDQVRSRLQLQPLRFEPRMFCGLDVAYPRGRPAVGAAVLLDAESLELKWSLRRERPAAFPYIPGHLSFREVPLLLQLWEAAREEGGPETVCFVDGNGMLHPRRAGVASCFGVLADAPTIGVGKSLLCGRVDTHAMSATETRPVEHDGEVIATAMKSRDASRPIYISVGNQMTLADASRLSRRCLTTHRVPEPIYYADRLSKTPRGRRLGSNPMLDWT
jgi:deoxyribonuclease V